MRKVEYSGLVRKKLMELKARIAADYGEKTAMETLRGLMNDADRLAVFERSGVSISEIYDVDTDYWYLFTRHHYLVYRIEPKSVIVVQMFHEREDFMMKLFGISGRTQESIDYWGE